MPKKSRKKRQKASSNIRWKIHDDGIVKTFTRRGRVTALVVLTSIFACVFVNGILTALVTVSIGNWFNAGVPPLGMMIFAPVLLGTVFVLLGLPAILMTLLVPLQFLCRYTITLDDHSVRYRRSWIGIGRCRVWLLFDIGSVSVRHKKGKLHWFDILRNVELSDAYDDVTNPYPFFVQFFDHEEQPLGIIPDLLEGEARWFVSQIRQKKNDVAHVRRS